MPAEVNKGGIELKKEKYSSLHEDCLTPDVARYFGEYNDYPNRFNPKEKSVLTRIEQFGISLDAVRKEFGKDITELSQEEYDALIAKFLKERYDTVVASVFDKHALPNNTKAPDSQTRWNEMLKQIERFDAMGDNFGLKIIQRGKDFRESGNVVLVLEAGAHLISSIADIEKLIEHNVKIFGLQYGQDTPLATANGLTEFGRKAVQYLLDNQLIVDLAHSSAKTRKDVLDLAEKTGRENLIAYTHGSTVDDIIESWINKIGERALRQEEAERLITDGGIIGLGVSRPFFSGIESLTRRINELTKLKNGMDRVAIGADFGGVPQEWLAEIRSTEDFKKIADLLSDEFHMDRRQIEKVLRFNAKNWIKKAIH